MISEEYRTHRDVTGPMNFKKKGSFFFGKSSSRDFGAPGCYPSTLIDLANTAPADGDSVDPKNMISEGYRTNTGVTGPMNFKKSGRFFFGQSCSQIFGAFGCHPSVLIDLANTALASRSIVKTICMIPEGYRTHIGVNGPMNFKKKDIFFGKSCSRDFGDPGCYPSTLIVRANTALASKNSVKPICKISEGYRTHRGVTDPMNFKKSRGFFSENRVPGILGPLAAIQTL